MIKTICLQAILAVTIVKSEKQEYKEYFFEANDSEENSAKHRVSRYWSIQPTYDHDR